MSKSSRRELLLSLQPQYRAATWAQKQQLLDGFVAATGYGRKYAIVLLNTDVVVKPQKRDRRLVYGADVKDVLLEIWSKAGNRLCSKRLVSILPVLVAKMEEFGHLRLSNELKTKVSTISAASIDRLLQVERKKQGRGRSTTKPGFLIKKHIPIRTFADWNDAAPGFLEADLVAHCGESVHGQFLNTLTVTDISTTWTETVALLRRSEADVIHGLTEIQKTLPFPILGLDTDNGGEFINYALLDWCKENRVTFTRAREYKKNDQAHVEQKNSSVVRRLIGYDRYEGVDSWRALSSLYGVYRLYVNFFQPSQKLKSKSRNGARSHRVYEKALTPFERVLKSASTSEDTKEYLRGLFKQLDPVLLLSEIERMQQEFWRMALTGEAALPPSCVRPTSSNSTNANVLIDPNANKPRRKRSDKPTQKLPQSGAKRGRKTTLDEVWPSVCKKLQMEPSLSCIQIFNWLKEQYPNKFRKTQISTIAEKLQRWRTEHHPDRIWAAGKPGKKTLLDEVWPEICDELERNPSYTTRGIMVMLCERYPGKFRLTQRSTLTNKIKTWRSAHIQSLSVSGSKPIVTMQASSAEKL